MVVSLLPLLRSVAAPPPPASRHRRWLPPIPSEQPVTRTTPSEKPPPLPAHAAHACRPPCRCSVRSHGRRLFSAVHRPKPTWPPPPKLLVHLRLPELLSFHPIVVAAGLLPPNACNRPPSSPSSAHGRPEFITAKPPAMESSKAGQPSFLLSFLSASPSSLLPLPPSVGDTAMAATPIAVHLQDPKLPSRPVATSIPPPSSPSSMPRSLASPPGEAAGRLPSCCPRHRPLLCSPSTIIFPRMPPMAFYPSRRPPPFPLSAVHCAVASFLYTEMPIEHHVAICCPPTPPPPSWQPPWPPRCCPSPSSSSVDPSSPPACSSILPGCPLPSSSIVAGHHPP